MKATETAVILIEFQNEFCREGGKLYDLVREEMARLDTIANGAKLLQAARGKGCLVVHSPFVFDEKWAEKNCVCGILAGAKENGDFRPGDWGTELIDEMKAQDGEVVLEGKRALSAFANTSLAEILEKNNIKNVICAGFLSNVCVESTARSAYDLGYKVYIAKDASASGAESNQNYVEEQIYPLLGEALTVDEIAGQLE